MVQWAMGPPLGLAALAGILIAACGCCAAAGARGKLILVSVQHPVPRLFRRAVRQVPALHAAGVPALAVLAAFALVWLWDAGNRPRGLMPARTLRVCAAAAIAVVVGYSAWYAGAFTTLYLRPLSRILASEWIYRSIPAGATLGVEHWDDQLPLDIPDGNPDRYKYVTLALYDEESPKKAADLAANLDRVDYVVLASYQLGRLHPTTARALSARDGVLPLAVRRRAGLPAGGRIPATAGDARAQPGRLARP